MEEHKTDEYAIFKRNENYWGEKPKVEKIKVKVIPDAETRVLAFEKGELDLIYGEGVISLDAYKRLQSTGQYETSLSEPVATRQLVMNTKKNSFLMNVFVKPCTMVLIKTPWWKALPLG